jgi:hypothetical protein
MGINLTLANRIRDQLSIGEVFSIINADLLQKIIINNI